MKKIVVLGAGYAGLKTVVELQKKLKGQVEITLVDQNDYHYEA
ncbi:MAG TPA: NAD(P)/FAD-dependent oxidoreductase, partial [Candidatus Limosilactobacillus intestinipullorum]|nr:NAD(P)/FAD-dependent oxidoreductase [Candidatus Limosilactobacillus intestinipullorum]HJA22483.1 NAD(P)/FAD-dependent oxidoreductase [Candidatus Limosilactobacillus intestinipullorum]